MAMQLTGIIMLACCLQVNAVAFGQQVTIQKKNMTLREVFKDIRKQSGYNFLYSNKTIAGSGRVSLDVTDADVPDILDQAFAGKALTYTIENKVIIIKREPILSKSASEVPLQNEISGVVKDSATGEPLVGVTIKVKGENIGTVTDAQGKFTLEVPEDAVLEVSYVGYKSQEVSTEGQMDLQILLVTAATGLDQLVVVGYGTQKKKDLTGSVGSIQVDGALAKRPSVDVGQNLYGKISGVNVIRGTARPGTSPTIQIRGSNSISAGTSPLIIVDGVQLPDYDLNAINNDDIKSIEVLKDASAAAIYGSRGANGVIIITTKSGRKGTPHLNLNYSYSLQKVVREIDVMNGPEYAAAAIDAAQNGWIASGGDPNAPNSLQARGDVLFTWPEALEHPQNLPNTNWQDLIFRTAPMHKINLNYSGGNEKSQYYLSGGYVNQDGIIITSEYQKYTLNLNLNTDVKDWLGIGGMLNGLFDHERQPFYRITEWAVQYPPIYPVYGKDGYLGGPNTMEVPGFAPYNGVLFRPHNGHPLYEINRNIQHRRFTGMGNFHVNLKFSKNLSFKSQFNTFFKRKDNSVYMPRNHNVGPGIHQTAQADADMVRQISYNWQNILTYNKNIGNHSFHIIAGYEYNYFDNYGISASRRKFENDNIEYLSAGEEILEANDHENENILISYFGRINYNFSHKYLLTASFRRDGSSRFGPNNKWGTFPSFAVGWRLSNESFMEPLENVFSNLKIRLSYGLSGNDQFGDYRWITKMSHTRVAIGNNLVTSYYPTSIENDDLAWERTRQLNIGLDLGFFDQRITLESNLYYTRSSSLLLNVPIPSTSGFTSVFTNIGQVNNNGFELNLTSYNIVSRLHWTTMINFSMNRNKIISLGENNASMIFNTNSFGGMGTINKVGEPIFNYYGYKYEGVYMNQKEIDNDPAAYESATPGDGKYKDVNEDGKLNSDDRTSIGNYEPDFIWGITNELHYKNLSLSILLQGVVGGNIYDDDAHRFLLYHEGRNYSSALLNRWRSPSDPGDGYYPKLTTVIKGFQKTPSSLWLDDATYLRLKSISLGYKLPERFVSRVGVASAEIFFNGMNLLTINEANVFDPESFIRANGSFSDPQNRGVGGTGYPSAKVYTFGVSLKF